MIAECKLKIDFLSYDKNGDGWLCMEEFTNMFNEDIKHLNLKEEHTPDPAMAWAKMDANKDNRITMEEYMSCV